MQDRPDALKPGTLLEGYRFERVLGAGGFGITYYAVEELIGRAVAIKEFLPNGLAYREPGSSTVRPLSSGMADDYAWGLTRFRDEARTLVALRHPNIVPVLRYFEANGTGYLVMEFERGRSLGQILGQARTLEESEIREIAFPLLEGIKAVHARGFLHRDIKPDNIFIREDGTPVLLDFGAARQALVERSKSLTTIVTPGYAPVEQYEREGKQGPWTDVYAMGAVLYRCVAGKRPPDAPARMSARFQGETDPMTPAAEVARGRYSPALLAAADAALALESRARPQTADALAGMLRGESPATGHAGTLHAPPAQTGPRDATLVAGPSESPRGPAKRHVLAWASAAALLVLAGGAYAVLSGGPETARRPVVTRAVEETARKAEEQRNDAERRADEERKRADTQRRAEEEARRKSEEEQKERAEAERRERESQERKAAEERAKLEQEARRKAEEESRRRAEEERKVEEARKPQSGTLDPSAKWVREIRDAVAASNYRRARERLRSAEKWAGATPEQIAAMHWEVDDAFAKHAAPLLGQIRQHIWADRFAEADRMLDELHLNDPTGSATDPERVRRDLEAARSKRAAQDPKLRGSLAMLQLIERVRNKEPDSGTCANAAWPTSRERTLKILEDARVRFIKQAAPMGGFFGYRAADWCTVVRVGPQFTFAEFPRRIVQEFHCRRGQTCGDVQVLTYAYCLKYGAWETCHDFE
ncbi:MAG: protein kinase [Candidatus Odyssella sp.]|nr:protein kinase [Candidatus Odyssella sp.]